MFKKTLLALQFLLVSWQGIILYHGFLNTEKLYIDKMLSADSFFDALIFTGQFAYLFFFILSISGMILMVKEKLFLGMRLVYVLTVFMGTLFINLMAIANASFVN